MSVIDKLLQGSIDMHVHYGPDPRVERRVDALKGARQAEEVGMRAIVLKSHEYPTAPLAYILNQVVPNITVFGSITLDLEVGGLNTYALEASAKMGAKVVWMPTFTSANQINQSNIRGLTHQGIALLDREGRLLPVVGEVLDIIKSYRMVLATGHVSVSETFALVEEATKRGISKIIVTHALWPGLKAFTLEEQQQLAEKGAFIEHCFYHILPIPHKLDPMKIVEAVRAVGAEHCILSTDSGQGHNPAPAEGMRMMIAGMLICGLTEKEIEVMVKVNPAKLLGLD